MSNNIDIEVYSEKRIMCYLDLLGFKYKIANIIDDKELEIYAYIIDIAKQVTHEVEIVWFSDTFILYSEPIDFDIDIKHTVDMLIKSTNTIFKQMLRRGFPLQGAIDIGQFYINKNEHHYAGKAFINAYDEASSHEWAGVALTDNMSNYIIKENLDISSKNILKRYSIPTKVDKKKKLEVINWVKAMPEFTEDIITNSFKAYMKEKQWDERIQKKLENTIKFFRDSNGDTIY